MLPSVSPSKLFGMTCCFCFCWRVHQEILSTEVAKLFEVGDGWGGRCFPAKYSFLYWTECITFFFSGDYLAFTQLCTQNLTFLGLRDRSWLIARFRPRMSEMTFVLQAVSTLLVTLKKAPLSNGK